MPVKKKASASGETRPVVVEEEIAKETAAPIVEETPVEDASVSTGQALDEPKQDMVQSGGMQEDVKQEDVRRPESEDSGIWSNESNLTNGSSLSNKGRSKAPMYIALVVILAVLGAGGTYWYLQNRTPLRQDSAGQGEDLTQEPTPTPTVAFNRSEWTIEVLNGTTTAGLAARVASELKELGYNVVKTGNSSKKVDATEVYVNAAMRAKQEGLIEDLEGDWGISQVTGALEDSTASARIVVGDNAVEDSKDAEEDSQETEE